MVSADTCDAVFRYAQALADAGRSDIVTIPILVEGRREFSNMLLGPASLLFCTPAPDSDIDMEDPAMLEQLRERTAALGPQMAFAGGQDEQSRDARSADINQSDFL